VQIIVTVSMSFAFSPVEVPVARVNKTLIYINMELARISELTDDSGNTKQID